MFSDETEEETIEAPSSSQESERNKVILAILYFFSIVRTQLCFCLHAVRFISTSLSTLKSLGQL